MELVNEPFRYHLGGDDLSVSSLNDAIDQSLSYYRRIPPDTTFNYGKIKYSAIELIASLQLFLGIIEKEQSYASVIEKLEADFHLFRSTANNEGEGVLFTGYYEPIFDGSLTRTTQFNVPVYSVPDDLLVLNLGYFRDSLKNRTIVYRIVNNTIVPYYTRQEIMEQKVLAKQKKEIAWMRDPVDLFFMQIQGSGILLLPSGEKLKLSYNGSNGLRYSSIGKLLVDLGIMKLEEVSMQSIRDYLKNHPQSRDYVLNHNKNYTFFAVDKSIDGPKGNIEVPLTAHRSIATDSTIFPKGALAYIVSDLPVFTESWQEHSLEPFARFTVIQDTGGAIKGPGRVDLFWGNGILAEKSAGTMRSFGKLYLLVAKKETLNKFTSDRLLD
jgi:membrane-bound lytic murein transglycosylase A